MERIFSHEPMTPEEVIEAIITIKTMIMYIDAIYESWLCGGEFGELESGNADDAPGVSGTEMHDLKDKFSNLGLHMEEGTTEADQHFRSGPEPLGLDNSDSEFKQALEGSASREVSIPEGSDMELTDTENSESVIDSKSDSEFKQALEESAYMEVSIPEGSDMELTDIENSDTESAQDCGRGSESVIDSKSDSKTDQTLCWC